ncbi:50S ribosomal protein L7/L12 [Prevotella intermedia ZT]|uniref:50S ribosomal protein L7/L12 n=1 Tax=Prevotella intermedia ZT TaxID=1347790 RepID=A0AAP0YMB0_PREIN|nr:50S ribosomal protein L7/L12 [Prevotella intermedia ZT]
MITAFWNCKSVGFTDQNSRFYRAKPTLLERKTIGFIIH